jgi:hypothetical protein
LFGVVGNGLGGVDSGDDCFIATVFTIAGSCGLLGKGVGDDWNGCGVCTTTEASSDGRGVDTNAMVSVGGNSAQVSAFRVWPSGAAKSLLVWERRVGASSTGEAMLSEVGDQRSSRIISVGLA